MCVRKGVPGEADVAHTVSHVAVTGEAVLCAPLRGLTAALGPGQQEAPARRGVPPVGWVRRLARFNQLKELILTARSKLYRLTDVEKNKRRMFQLSLPRTSTTPPLSTLLTSVFLTAGLAEDAAGAQLFRLLSPNTGRAV